MQSKSWIVKCRQSMRDYRKPHHNNQTTTNQTAQTNTQKTNKPILSLHSNTITMQFSTVMTMIVSAMGLNQVILSSESHFVVCRPQLCELFSLRRLVVTHLMSLLLFGIFHMYRQQPMSMAHTRYLVVLMLGTALIAKGRDIPLLGLL